MSNPSPVVSPRPAPPDARLEILEADVPTHLVSQRPVETPDGRRYRLFIATPRRQAPRSGFPILYMLDGNAAFDTLTPDLLASVPGLVIAGIGYETPRRFDTRSRMLDYTPARGGGPSPDPERPDRMIGGAAAFLDRLCGDIRAEAERGLAVDDSRRALWGHSMAGLCVLLVLLTRPSSFSRYVSASPSIWWGDEYLLAVEERTRPAAPVCVEALVMLGDSERRSNPAGPHWEGPAPHTLEMIRRLGGRPGTKVSSRIFPGLGHAATLDASLPPALAFAAR